MSMCGLGISNPSASLIYLAGVNSSSHISTPITVSSVATTASPKGTVFYLQLEVILQELAHLAGDFTDDSRQGMLFDLTMFVPRSEVSQFSLT